MPPYPKSRDVGGDRARKLNSSFGFRLPSAIDNSLKFTEFEGLINQVIFVALHLRITIGTNWRCMVEQIVRPTGLWIHD